MIRKYLELMIATAVTCLLSSCANSGLALAQEPAAGNPADTPSIAQDSGPAGILIYCRRAGEIHILTANDRLGIRGWGGFGGGDKKGETTAVTAARETCEETRGYFKEPWLLQKIAGQKPVKIWGYSFYFAEVSYVPAAKIMNHPVSFLNPAFLETQHYAWVPFSEIEPLLSKTTLKPIELRLDPRHLQKGSRSHSYWRVWIDNMRQLQLKNAFPWSP